MCPTHECAQLPPLPVEFEVSPEFRSCCVPLPCWAVWSNSCHFFETRF